MSLRWFTTNHCQCCSMTIREIHVATVFSKSMTSMMTDDSQMFVIEALYLLVLIWSV